MNVTDSVIGLTIHSTDGQRDSNLEPSEMASDPRHDHGYQMGTDYDYIYGDMNCSWPDCRDNMSFIVYEDVHFWQTPQLIVLVLLFLFIVLGNSCVLLAIGLSQNGKKTRMNYFIMNLAIADLTVGLLFVAVDIAEKVIVFWHGGLVLCKIIRFVQSFVLYASTFMIVSLSIDRVDAIARPMKFTRKVVTVRTLVYTSWIISGLFSIPALILFDVRTMEGNSHCVLNFNEPWYWKIYMTLIALSIFIIPALIVIVCYAIIICVIWQKGRGFSNAFRASYRTPAGHMRSEDRGAQGIIPQAKVRTLKMTLGIVCVFVLSWSPYFIYNLLFVYGNPVMSPVSKQITALIQSLAPLNSAANPIIYGVFSTRICKNLRRIPLVACICDYLCRCRLNSHHTSRGPIASHTEQTYLDGMSAKSILRRYGNSHRLFTEHETSNLLPAVTHNGLAGHGLHTSKRGCQASPKVKVVENAEVVDSCEENNKRSNGIYTRRPSGLPLVNRRMTPHETILLETYCNNSSTKSYKKQFDSTPGRQTCLFANKSEPVDSAIGDIGDVGFHRSFSDNTIVQEDLSSGLKS